MSSLVRTLAVQIKAAKLPDPEFEIRFHPSRKWRLDLGWGDIMLACEADGGTWSGGRHVSGSGYEADARKINEAGLMGWLVLRFTGKMIQSGEALEMIERAFGRTKELGLEEKQ